MSIPGFKKKLSKNEIHQDNDLNDLDSSDTSSHLSDSVTSNSKSYDLITLFNWVKEECA